MRKKNQAFDSGKNVIVIGLCGESKAGCADGKTDVQRLFEALCRHTMSSCREAERFLEMLCSRRTAHPGEADFTGTFFCKMSGDGEEAVKISFVPGTAWIRIANVDLYHLFSALLNRWKESAGFPAILFCAERIPVL